MSTIALVDDNPAVLKSLKSVVTKLGHDVVPFSDPRDVLDAFRADLMFADCLLTDYLMPELNGVALYEAIRNLRPDLPAIMVSGVYDIIEINTNHFSTVLPKPFLLQEIRVALQEALGIQTQPPLTHSRVVTPVNEQPEHAIPIPSQSHPNP